MSGVNRTSAEESAVESFGKIVFGGAVGFALYLLVTGLGLGGRGEGRGESGRGEAKLPIVPLPPPPPSALPPPRPRDEKRLTFVMTQPTADDPSRPMNFRGPEMKVFSLEEMIARIKAGGRSDVTLKIVGTVRAGSATSALELVNQAGIKVWTEDAPGGDRVSGNARGQYGSYS